MFPIIRAEDIVKLRISPVGVVEEREKPRVIHDLTFCRGGATMLKIKGMRAWEMTMDTGSIRRQMGFPPHVFPYSL